MTEDQEKRAQELFDVRHAYWNSANWDYTEWEELEHEIRSELKIPFGEKLDWSPK